MSTEFGSSEYGTQSKQWEGGNPQMTHTTLGEGVYSDGSEGLGPPESPRQEKQGAVPGFESPPLINAPDPRAGHARHGREAGQTSYLDEEIPAPPFREKKPPAYGQEQKLGRTATDAAIRGGRRLNLPPDRNGQKNTPNEESSKQEELTEEDRQKFLDHMLKKPPVYENTIAAKLIERPGAKATIVADQRTEADGTMTRTVAEFVVDHQHEVGFKKVTKVLVGHMAPNTRDRTTLTSAAGEGAFNLVTADITDPQSRTTFLNVNDVDKSMAQTIGGTEDYGSVLDVHANVTKVLQQHVTGGKTPAPADYRDAFRILGGDVAKVWNDPMSKLSPKTLRAIVDAVPENTYSAKSSIIDRARIFYEQHTSETPASAARVIEGSHVPGATVYNIGYEGYRGKAAVGAQTVIETMIGAVVGTAGEGEPDLVVLTNVDLANPNVLEAAVELANHCNIKRIPFVQTAGNNLSDAHLPLLNGTAVYAAHDISTSPSAASTISKAAGVRPDLAVQSETRNHGGNLGGSVGTGNNKGRGPGDAYITSEGESDNKGGTTGLALGKAQQLAPGLPRMPAGELEETKPDEIAVFGPAISEAMVHSTETGYPTARLPRFEVKVIEVDESMVKIAKVQKDLVSEFFDSETIDIETIEGEVEVRALEAGKPPASQQRIADSAKGAGNLKSGKAAIPIPLPNFPRVGANFLAMAIRDEGGPDRPGKIATRATRDKYAAEAYKIYLQRESRGQVQAGVTWPVWAGAHGLPGYEEDYRAWKEQQR